MPTLNMCLNLNRCTTAHFRKNNTVPKRCAVKSLRWVSDYRTDRVDSIKLFSSVRQNMISWHFRPLRWVSDYRTDRVDSIKLFSSYRQNSLPSLVAVKSLRWVSDYRTNRVDSIKLFSSVRQNMISWHFRPALHWTPPPPKIDLQGCLRHPCKAVLFLRIMLLYGDD